MKASAKAKLKVQKKYTTRDWWSLILWTICILAWVGASIIASQIVVGKIMILILGRETFAQTVPTAVFSALSYVVAMIMIIFVPAVITWQRKKRTRTAGGKEVTVERIGPTLIRPKLNRNDLGLRGLPTWTDIGLAPVGFIVALLLAAVLTWLFSLFPWFNAEETQEVGFSVYVMGIDRILAFLTLVIVAPIAEEIIFRGWLYGKLREKTSDAMSNLVSVMVSSLLVSLLFGLIHMQWNVALNVFAMSIVMCVLREITGTIYAGILLHMLKNGLAFYLLFVMGI